MKITFCQLRRNFSKVAGCTLIVIGVWLLIDPNKGHLLNLFAATAAPTETIQLVGYSLVGFGITVLTVGFYGCRAALHRSQCVVVVYMVLLIGLILAELVVATILGLMSYNVLSGMESRLAERMSEHYGHDTSSDGDFTLSLDYAQYKFNCCGIHTDQDFNGTAWWRDSQISGLKRQVPLTCCVLKDTEAKNTGSPMSVISRVFYKNNEKPWLYPQPKDEAACQAQDIAVHENSRHKKGCLRKINEWIQSESVTLIFFGVAVAGAQIFGVITSTCLCRTMGNGHGG